MDITEIQEQWPFLGLMHPAHLTYIKAQPLNTLQYFVKTLYDLEPDKRDEIIKCAWYFLFYSEDEREESRSLLRDKDSEKLFEEFAVKCLQVSKVFHEVLLVMAMTQYMLYELSRLGDKTNTDRIKSNLVGLADHIQRDNAKEGELGRDEFVDRIVEDATNLEEKTEEYYNLYVYFCENVLVRLEDQRKMWNQQLMEKYNKERGDEEA
jgi:hypothetical protein